MIFCCLFDRNLILLVFEKIFNFVKFITCDFTSYKDILLLWAMDCSELNLNGFEIHLNSFLKHLYGFWNTFVRFWNTFAKFWIEISTIKKINNFNEFVDIHKQLKGYNSTAFKSVLMHASLKFANSTKKSIVF